MEEYTDNQAEGRRLFRRFSSAQPVWLRMRDPNRYGGTLSCDLSEGGIRVHLNDFVPLNEELYLSIQLEDESVVECPCRVAWVEKNRFSDRYQAGLSFVETDTMLESQEKIRGFLSHQK